MNSKNNLLVTIPKTCIEIALEKRLHKYNINLSTDKYNDIQTIEEMPLSFLYAKEVKAPGYIHYSVSLCEKPRLSIKEYLERITNPNCRRETITFSPNTREELFIIFKKQQLDSFVIEDDDEHIEFAIPFLTKAFNNYFGTEETFPDDPIYSNFYDHDRFLIYIRKARKARRPLKVQGEKSLSSRLLTIDLVNMFVDQFARELKTEG